jgi:hypothetical protein
LSRPNFPSVGATPEHQRLLAAVREFVQDMFRSGQVSRVNVGAQSLRIASGTVAAVSWGITNRVEPPYSGYIALPRPRPDAINVPLYVAKTVPTGMLHFLAIPGDNGVQPKINGSPTGLVATGARLMHFLNDGRDWFV